MPKSPFLDSIYEYMITRRYSRRTIKSYLYWIRGFIVYHRYVHPQKLSERHVEDFLSYLAVERKVSASTQKIALNSLVFLYKHILLSPLKDVGQFSRAKRQRKLPVVLTREEVSALMFKLCGVSWLMAALLYGSGLRRIELVRLRVKDIDLDHLQIRVWNGKGFKHRVTTLAPELKEKLIEQFNTMQEQLGHADVATTEIYTHVLKRGAYGVQSPFSKL